MSIDVIRHTWTRISDVAALLSSNEQYCQSLFSVSEAIGRVIESGGTIYSCGNGGSACDAMHFTEELVARFKRERPGIRAMHFMDGATLTCWSNDYDFESAFERQAQTFCTDKDLLLAISTSGKSENILRAVKAAKKSRTFCVGLTGKDGGELKDLCDVTLLVPIQETERIQEAHIASIHILCELIEAP